MRQFIAGGEFGYRRAKANHRVTNAIYREPQTTYRALKRPFRRRFRRDELFQPRFLVRR
jgi:hypothetical protein